MASCLRLSIYRLPCVFRKSFLRLVRVVFYCPTWQTSTVTKIRSAVTRGALRATAASNLSSRFAVSGSDISAANRLGSELQDVRPLLWRLKSRRRQPSIHMGCGLQLAGLPDQSLALFPMWKLLGLFLCGFRYLVPLLLDRNLCVGAIHSRAPCLENRREHAELSVTDESQQRVR